MNPDTSPFCLDSFWESFFLEKNCQWEAMAFCLVVGALLGAHCYNLSFCLEPMSFWSGS